MRFVVLLAVATLCEPASAQQTPWRTTAAGYTMVTSSGLATDPAGATIAIRSDSVSGASGVSGAAFGMVSATIPADNYRARRVSIEADVDARNVTGGASPWIRADGPAGMLILENGTDQAVRGTATAHRVVTIYVPAAATNLIFGLLLSGKGEAQARSLKLVAGPPIDAAAPLADVARHELDSAFALVRAHALWRDTVTWSKVEPEVRAVAAGAQTAEDVYPAIRQLLARLGDHHSFFMRPSGAQQFRTGGAGNPRPAVKLLPDSTGYVSIPAYAGVEATAQRAYAQGLQDSLAAIAPAVGCRWIVDLRGNGGGNMWPMLGGLRPFLGDEGLGAFVTNAGSAPLWHARDAVDVPPAASIAGLESAYVAVLYGPRTASSGEAVAISFRGRPRTRSFGVQTAGLSTANSTYSLPSGSMIVLTVSVEADRTGKRYGEKLQPDEVIPAAPAGSDDPQLAHAVAWLRSQSCRP